jgi:hypothetical protein
LTLKQMTAIVLTAISGTGLVACGSSEPDEDRGAAAVALCREHGGVIAFDDEVVICRDQTSHRIE